ncbi:MAG TPA: hypothetical protein VNU68_32705 [Verrucomicrobiae bacterium]|nr:hypothetical protein [Verrucomicrobiae bacterium]
MQPDLDQHATLVVPADRIEIKRLCRPKTTRFKMLSLLWIFPSAGAVVILAADAPAWIHQPGITQGLASVPLQSWLAVTLLAAHGLFVYLARHYHRTEPWREVVFCEPGPQSGPTAPSGTISS